MDNTVFASSHSLGTKPLYWDAVREDKRGVIFICLTQIRLFAQIDVPSVVHFCKLHFSKHIFFNNLHVINNIHAKISARSLVLEFQDKNITVR